VKDRISHVDAYRATIGDSYTKEPGTGSNPGQTSPNLSTTPKPACEATEAVSAHFRLTAVGIEHPHCDSNAVPSYGNEKPICTNAEMAITHLSRKAAEVKATEATGFPAIVNNHEVIARTVPLLKGDQCAPPLVLLGLTICQVCHDLAGVEISRVEPPDARVRTEPRLLASRILAGH